MDIKHYNNNNKTTSPPENAQCGASGPPVTPNKVILVAGEGGSDMVLEKHRSAAMVMAGGALPQGLAVNQTAVICGVFFFLGKV